MPQTEPVCTEITATVSISGKVQVVKYEYSEDFFFSWGRTYSIPDDWDEEDVQKFQAAKTQEYRDVIDEEFATPAVEILMEKREELN